MIMWSRVSQNIMQPLRHLSRSVRASGLSLSVRSMSSTQKYDFTTLKVTNLSEYVKHVELNRPEKRNAMNTAFWKEIVECFNTLAVDADCRVIILSGAGKMFTAGLDLQGNDIFTKIMSDMDVGRKAFFIHQSIKELQESFNVIEKCSKPVIAAIHNGCLGAGVDMIAASDMRYCTRDAWFSIREVDIGLAADLGTLQRFQKITGNDSLTRELTYSARNFPSDEAKSIGLVSRIFQDKEEMMKGTLEMANLIASKSPVAVQASKQVMVYSRDHSVPEALEYQSAMNSALLQSEDVMKAAMAAMSKEKAVFSKL